jgi:hypothetical protein
VIEWLLALAKIVAVIGSLGGVAIALLVAAWFLPRFREWLLIAAGVAIAAGIIYGWGVHDARDLAEANLVRLQKRFDAMQHRVNAGTARHVQQLQAVLEQNDQALNTVVKTYEDELARRPAGTDQCTLDDADVRSLQHIDRAGAAGKRR